VGSSTKELNDLWGGAKFMFRLNNKLCRAGLSEDKKSRGIFEYEYTIYSK
jgi:hypothetical protein